ncbi:MAG: hypothetical protein KKF44_09825 [Nanoarchaeota archaeon]|nr:hypothetical protein [Nanoarchaeota archaeon]
MKDHFESDIFRVKDKDGTHVYKILVPCVLTNPKMQNVMTQTSLLVDTGSDKSLISNKIGIDIGLEAPKTGEKIKNATDASGNSVPYIERTVNLYIGKNIKKLNFKICWCTRPKLTYNFLGMDFFEDFKLILMGGNHSRFYITKQNKCVACNKK